MSREASALAAVQARIPDDTILDVALTYPRGYTRAQAAGGLIGGAAGGSNNFVGVGVALGTAVGGKLFANLKDLPASIVLAVSPTAVYALGRPSIAVVGHWDDLTPMVKFDRRTLEVETHQHTVTLDITLRDTEHDVSLPLEAKRVGSLDAKAFVRLLTSPPEDQ